MIFGSLLGAYVSVAKYAANRRLSWWRTKAPARYYDGSGIKVDGFDSVGIFKLGKGGGNVPYAELEARPIKLMTDSAMETALANVLGDYFEYDRKDGFFRRISNDDEVARTTWSSDDRTRYRFLLFDQSGAYLVQKLMEEISKA